MKTSDFHAQSLQIVKKGMVIMKRFKITDLGIGILFTLLFISLGVIITINFRPLYYLDIDLLNIEETSGYSKAVIRENYDTLIDYSSPFFRGELDFPSLPASQPGLIHFTEVKNIFTFFYVLGAITLVAGIGIIVYKHKKKEYNYLLVSSITAVVLPLLLGLLLAIDFDKAFLVFHKLFFNNDYWLFDPVTDPVIQILPDTFFLHCALLIIFFVILGSIACLVMYLIKRRHFSIRYRRTRDLRF
jgi:integral membrane protein (TIGR01906 family)